MNLKQVDNESYQNVTSDYEIIFISVQVADSYLARSNALIEAVEIADFNFFVCANFDCKKNLKRPKRSTNVSDFIGLEPRVL